MEINHLAIPFKTLVHAAISPVFLLFYYAKRVWVLLILWSHTMLKGGKCSMESMGP